MERSFTNKLTSKNRQDKGEDACQTRFLYHPSVNRHCPSLKFASMFLIFHQFQKNIDPLLQNQISRESQPQGNQLGLQKKPPLKSPCLPIASTVTQTKQNKNSYWIELYL